MSMQYLSIENASKSYGEKVLLNNVSLTISKGEKIALIAKNGSGKTTLMRVLIGKESAEGENSKIIIANNIQVAFLDQDPDIEGNITVIDAIFESDFPILQTVRNYENAMLSEDPIKIQEANLAMDDHRAWDVEANIKKILASLKIDYLTQKVDTLSGGQKKRIALAKVIIEEPDFLVLDEPTNHLDIEMIEWLESYLKNSSLTLFMVTHDRYFLENVCTHMIELDRGELFTYKGNYSQYLVKRDARLANESVVYEKTKKLFKKELEWIRRQPQARGTKAKSRISDFDIIKDKVSNKRIEDDLKIGIEPVRLGSKIVEFHNVSKAYGDKKLMTSFSYKFKKGERVGIVGVNGAGKSTMVKLMVGETTVDSGKMVIGDTVLFGYYDQEGLDITNDKTVIDVIRDIAEFIPLAKGKKMTAETLLERFLFPRSQQRVFISQLSGGERRRLYLLTVLVKNPNFLILDEPTNDLDIITLNVLEDYLMEYPGCLVIITHDRYFMDKLVDHVFVVEGGGNIKDFNGSYSEYRNSQISDPQITESKKPSAEIKTDNKQDYELRKEIKNVEKQIEKLTTRKAKITESFNDMSLSPEKIQEMSDELTDLNAQIETKEEHWMELMED